METFGLNLSANVVKQILEQNGWRVYVVQQPARILQAFDVRTLETTEALYVLFSKERDGVALVRCGEKGSKKKIRVYSTRDGIKTVDVE